MRFLKTTTAPANATTPKMDAITLPPQPLLEESFPGIIKSEVWKKRCWRIIFHYFVFYILRDWNVSILTKYNAIKEIFSFEDFEEYRNNLDIYMADDADIWRKLFFTKNVLLLMVVWYAISLKSVITK